MVNTAKDTFLTNDELDGPLDPTPQPVDEPVAAEWTVEDDVELLMSCLRDTGQLTEEQRARVAHVQDNFRAKEENK